ncbi:MAG TPA: hypothetical protein VEQ40_02520, partial [Pyrinomonadaceae bacterium]|nr:hypothetical protein [Pyrinomonadaceae bacterium]
MSRKLPRKLFSSLVGAYLIFACTALSSQAHGQSQPQQQAAPVVDEWTDGFDGKSLDSTKWEVFNLEGGAGKVDIKDGQLQMRGHSGSRAGVRSKPTFTAERFIVEA